MIEDPDWEKRTRHWHNVYMRRSRSSRGSARRSRAPITLYLGCSPETARGIFWTTSLFEAALYAYNKDNSILARAEVRPKDVLSTFKSLGSGPQKFMGMIWIDSGEHVIHIDAARTIPIKTAPFQEVASLYRQTCSWPKSRLAERDELFADALQTHWRHLPSYSTHAPSAKNADRETNRYINSQEQPR